MRTFKQIGEVSPDMGHYTYPRFRKPIRPVQEGEVVKIVYIDGREDIIRIAPEPPCDRCSKCFYGKDDYFCPVWRSSNKEVWCLIGPGHIAVDINSILEDL